MPSAVIKYSVLSGNVPFFPKWPFCHFWDFVLEIGLKKGLFFVFGVFEQNDQKCSPLKKGVPEFLRKSKNRTFLGVPKMVTFWRVPETVKSRISKKWLFSQSKFPLASKPVKKWSKNRPHFWTPKKMQGVKELLYPLKKVQMDFWFLGSFWQRFSTPFGQNGVNMSHILWSTSDPSKRGSKTGTCFWRFGAF